MLRALKTPQSALVALSLLVAHQKGGILLARNNLGLFHTCNKGSLAALIRHFPNPVGGGGRGRASERERGRCKRACAREIVRERVRRERESARHASGNSASFKPGQCGSLVWKFLLECGISGVAGVRGATAPLDPQQVFCLGFYVM